MAAGEAFGATFVCSILSPGLIESDTAAARLAFQIALGDTFEALDVALLRGTDEGVPAAD